MAHQPKSKPCFIVQDLAAAQKRNGGSLRKSSK